MYKLLPDQSGVATLVLKTIGADIILPKGLYPNARLKV